MTTNHLLFDNSASVLLAPATIRVDNLQVMRLASLAMHAIARCREGALAEAIAVEIATRVRWNSLWWVPPRLHRATDPEIVRGHLRGYNAKSNRLRECEQIGMAAQWMAEGLFEMAAAKENGWLFIARREWEVMLPWALRDAT